MKRYINNSDLIKNAAAHHWNKLHLKIYQIATCSFKL